VSNILDNKAYIVGAFRSPIGKSGKRGIFKDTRPEDMAAFMIKESMKKVPNLKPEEIDDVVIGCSFPEGTMGFNMGRAVALIAGLPNEIPGMTINRFCSSGLQSIAIAVQQIEAGLGGDDVIIAGGVELMSSVPLGGNSPRPYPDPKFGYIYTPMGITAENVADRYGISRQDQDEFAYSSHMKAKAARDGGLYKEIIPTPATIFKNGEKSSVIVEHDQGIRDETTVEGLGKLRPVFKKNGSVTAGNSSQTSDGAGIVIVMSGRKVKELGIKPVSRLINFTVAGCHPDEMGVGPKYAIPKLLKVAGMDVKDIGVFELNEAFASQALHCVRELGLDLEKVNLYGGAIALGHPLGCTGAKLCATLLTAMKAKNAKFGVESMCIGGGMGAAGLFEFCE
jgi:acetyl-CoA acyltransferase